MPNNRRMIASNDLMILGLYLALYLKFNLIVYGIAGIVQCLCKASCDSSLNIAFLCITKD